MSTGALKPLITGWHRGGLGYVAEVLRAGGIPVSTELGPDTTPAELRAKLQEKVQVTPYAVPFLDKLPADVSVTFVHRDPMRVVNSLFASGTFHGERRSPISSFVYHHLGGFKAKHSGKPAQAAVAYVNNWVRLAEGLRRLRFARVEMGASALFNAITDGYIPDFPKVSPSINASDCPQILRPKILPQGAIQQGMMSLLWKLKYHDSVYYPQGGHAHYVNTDWHC